jgi:hypothetical protein
LGEKDYQHIHHAAKASQQFADPREQGTLASNSDAHFKAKAFLRTQQLNLELTPNPRLGQTHLSLYDERQDEREKSGRIAESLSQPRPSLDKPNANTTALSKAEKNLHTLIHRINQDYRKSYKSQQLQLDRERQLRLIKDRGIEL